MTLSPDQLSAVDAIIASVEAKRSLLTVGGYAGTGKTVTISHAAKLLRSKKKNKKLTIAYVAFTGKAAMVMKEKLVAEGALDEPGDHCGTIHSLIYEPVLDENEIVIGWRRRLEIPQDVIVIDEASMVGGDVFQDLAAFYKPIVAVGDHGQLPPVNSDFNLMANPTIRLEKIHRQAEGNPIIKLSMMARNRETIPLGVSDGPRGEFVRVTSCSRKEAFGSINVGAFATFMFLCGRNSTRVNLNFYIRSMLGFSGSLSANEKVICLKNNRREGIYNGMGGIAQNVDSAGEDFLRLTVRFEAMNGYRWTGLAFARQFGIERTLKDWTQGPTNYGPRDLENLFDFGYALTVHKAQGSQSDRVMVFDERMSFMSDDEYARWLYTAITRSSRDLVLVKNA